MRQQQPVRSQADPVASSPVRMAAFGGSLFFLVMTILGFIPGFTTEFDLMEFAGPDSEAKRLGLMSTSALQNLVYLAFGVVGYSMSRSVERARAYLFGGGAVLAVLWFYGTVVPPRSAANFLPADITSNIVHFLLAVAMVACGLLLAGARADRGEREQHAD